VVSESELEKVALFDYALEPLVCLIDLVSCKYHACNHRRTYVWIAQFWKHEFPLNIDYSS